MTTTSEMVRSIGRVVACPVGQAAADPHEFMQGSGVLVEWDVMGDPRTAVEVCSSCAGTGGE